MQFWFVPRFGFSFCVKTRRACRSDSQACRCIQALRAEKAWQYYAEVVEKNQYRIFAPAGFQPLAYSYWSLKDFNFSTCLCQSCQSSFHVSPFRCPIFSGITYAQSGATFQGVAILHGMFRGSSYKKADDTVRLVNEKLLRFTLSHCLHWWR